MGIELEQGIFLLFIAVLVALIARKLRLPYTVGLVIAGIGLAQWPFQNSMELTHAFIFDIILPPLLFEAALNIHWKELRRDLLPVLTLAVFGVLIAAGFVAVGMAYFLHWPFASALVFGVLIAATDPVAVIAMFKDSGVSGRLRLLVESESLLNDGVAAVFFALALTYAQTGEASSGSAMLQSLAFTVGGGIAIGLLSGRVAIGIAGHSDEHLLESTLTAVAAYGSFILAERLHMSGVLATVAAGLVMGNLPYDANVQPDDSSKNGRSFLYDLWEFIAFLANSLVFLLMGLSLATIRFATLGWSVVGIAIAFGAYRTRACGLSALPIVCGVALVSAATRATYPMVGWVAWCVRPRLGSGVA